VLSLVHLEFLSGVFPFPFFESGLGRSLGS
jgi:hypothetical protein